MPAGETITIIAGPRADDERLVDVQWGTRMLMMFVEDLQKRAELVKGEPA
jgi:hypothetical protein